MLVIMYQQEVGIIPNYHPTTIPNFMFYNNLRLFDQKRHIAMIINWVNKNCDVKFIKFYFSQS